MTAEQLLRLYPRAWRERYGEEFLAVTGDGSLTLQQRIDIVSGAIDAWLSADVRDVTRPAIPGGTPMSVRSMICSTGHRYTTRDGWIGAAVMIVTSILIVAAGTAVKQAGYPDAAEAMFNLGFMVSFAVSMPFWLMKGQPWKAQVTVVSIMTLLLVAMGVVTALN